MLPYLLIDYCSRPCCFPQNKYFPAHHNPQSCDLFSIPFVASVFEVNPLIPLLIFFLHSSADFLVISSSFPAWFLFPLRWHHGKDSVQYLLVGCLSAWAQRGSLPNARGMQAETAGILCQSWSGTFPSFFSPLKKGGLVNFGRNPHP